MQPNLVSGQTDHLDGRKPFRRIGSRITQRRQLAHGHQNLNVTLRKTKQFRRLRDIKARQQMVGGEKAPRLVTAYCFSRKKRFPVGGVMVMLFVPLAVLMEKPLVVQPAGVAKLEFCWSV